MALANIHTGLCQKYWSQVLGVFSQMQKFIVEIFVDARKLQGELERCVDVFSGQGQVQVSLNLQSFFEFHT